MNSTPAAHDQHQKDFLNAFFQSEPPPSSGGDFDPRPGEADPSLFHGGTHLPLPSMMNLGSQQQLGNPTQTANMEMLENLMAMQEQVGQAAASAQMGQQQQHPGTSPQMLLEQQMRIAHLQRLWQLQNQIFQQQMELLSGSSASFTGPSGLMDRSREQQQPQYGHGLPTPASSTELHAQPTSDFVSPMFLQTRSSSTGPPNTGLPSLPSLPPISSLSSQSQQHQAFLGHGIIPPAPHSAPANIAFETYGLQHPDMDFNEISPITSPWLGAAYGSTSSTNANANPNANTTTGANNGGNGGNGGGQGGGQNAPSKKRRTVSPAEDDRPTSSGTSISPNTGRPTRRRQQSVQRLTPASASASTIPSGPSGSGGSGKKSNLRGTKSANSTPLFPPTSSGMGMGTMGGMGTTRMSPVHRTATGMDVGVGMGMGMGMGTVGMNEIPGDTPSPVDLAMPPPSHPPHPSQHQQHQQLHFVHGGSSSPVGGSRSGRETPHAHGGGGGGTTPDRMMPVTPASIMNLGRLGAGSGLGGGSGGGIGSGSGADGGAEGRGGGGGGGTGQERGTGTRRSARARSSTVASGSNASLKPILPGNGPSSQTSPTTSSSNTTATSQHQQQHQQHQQQQPLLQVRKTSHKAAEQKRRDSLKKSYDELRVLLPPIPLPSDEGYPDEPPLPGAMPPRGPPKGNADGPNRSVSKLQLLRCGNEWIRVLKRRVERRDGEIERLRREVRRLRIVVGAGSAAPGSAGSASSGNAATGGAGAGEGGDGDVGMRTEADGEQQEEEGGQQTLEGEDEELDLERDLDACEASLGGIFGRSQMSKIMEGTELGDEDPGE